MTKMKTIVFDWGDTLMQTYPETVGPMVFWPEVAEVEGAGETLQKLNHSYNLVLATNASESSANQVQKALARVGLEPFVKEIFTYQELGFRKPERGFFRQIEKIMGTEPEDMVMVGDSFSSDVLGGHLAGWQTVWFNPKFQYAPGLAAIHNVEIFRMDELPEALKWLDLPDWEMCQTWYMEMSPSMRLWLHVQLVASTAYVLALWMRRKGCPINPLLVQRGGLLHDICKLNPDTTQQHRDHGEMGGEWLANKGQPELARIAHRHVLNTILDEKRSPKTMEEKIVYFADKLCEDARLVDLDTRITALKGRYPGYSSNIDASIPALRDLQKELALAAGIEEAKLVDQLREVVGSTR
jgi:HAD superfamily hydrolase (TIGR01662 family)